MKNKKKIVAVFSFVLIFFTSSVIVNDSSIVSKSYKNTNIPISEIFNSSQILETNLNSDNRNNVQVENTNQNNINQTNTNQTSTSQNTVTNEVQNETNENKTNENTQNTNDKESQVMPETTKTQLLTMKENVAARIEQNQKEYKNSPIFGTIKFVLENIAAVSILVIPTILIASFVYENVLGNEKGILREKGMKLRKRAIIFLIISQVLPLVFTILVNGWGI